MPPYPANEISVSGLLLGAGDIGATRDSLEAAAPGALRFRASGPLRVYAEVYGLAGHDGVVEYDATYRFERIGGGGLFGLSGRNRVTSVGFHRVAPASETHVESLRLDPGRLPKGRYRLVLEIRGPARDAPAAVSSIQFELR